MQKTISSFLLVCLLGIGSQASLAQRASNTLEMTEELRKELNEKALDYVERLGIYLTTIADKSSPTFEVKEATRLALQLFDREDATVEIQKFGETPIKRKIRDYLRRLRALPYGQVEIEWADIAFVSELQKGVDGNYYGTATVEQRFAGFRDGIAIYEDITTKYIEIVVRQSVVEHMGRSISEWEVFLSDIAVNQVWEG